MRRVIVFERILTHYRMRFYNYIVENYPNVEIVFLTTQIRQGEGFHTNLKDAKFTVKYLPMMKVMGFEFYKFPLNLMKSADSVVCVLSVTSISNFVYSLIARYWCIPFYWWGHSRNFSQGGFIERLKDNLKLCSTCFSSGILAYTANERDRFSKILWLRDKKIIPLGNTLDTDSIISICEAELFHKAPKDDLFCQLGNKSVIGLVGRLHKKRNAALAIELFMEISANRDDVVLLIIGDGTEYLKLKTRFETNNQIFFLGGIEDENELAIYMKRIDMFIHTGLVGLNLVHAMCYGKPNLVLDLPIHSPEIEYLKNGINGLLLKDVNEMKEAIVKLLSDKEEIERMGINGLNDIKSNINIRNMAANFLKILENNE